MLIPREVFERYQKIQKSRELTRSEFNECREVVRRLYPDNSFRDNVNLTRKLFTKRDSPLMNKHAVNTFLFFQQKFDKVLEKYKENEKYLKDIGWD